MKQNAKRAGWNYTTQNASSGTWTKPTDTCLPKSSILKVATAADYGSLGTLQFASIDADQVIITLWSRQYGMIWNYLLYGWGRIPELSQNCQDMTNSSSTYLGIAAGAAIGGIISWWIYNRQKKTADEQDFILKRIKELDENHDEILKQLERSEERHQNTLNAILGLSRKIDAIVEKQDKQF